MSNEQSREDAIFMQQRIEEASDKLRRAAAEIGTEVWGQDEVIERTLTCMVAGGHLLSVGVPGLAKTRLVSRVATVMGMTSWKRVQFKPDLMPSDILGSEVMEESADGSKNFVFKKGPIFTQFLMADEINRAGPKTQSALLEAMQERQVTLSSGETIKLQRPFTVMATQNPLEQEGTYPLPEAQLDRFLMRLNVDYPDEPAERKVMVLTTGSSTNIRELFERSARGEDLTRDIDKDEEMRVKPILGPNDLIIMQKIARQLPLSEDVVKAAMHIVRRARPDSKNAPDIIRESLEWGPGPRAVQALSLCAKARAVMQGRLAPNVEDILAIADPVLEHRMAIGYSAKLGGTTYKKDIRPALIKGL